MRVTDLIPWRPTGTSVAPIGQNTDPFGSLQFGVNRLFDDFWRDLDFPFPASMAGGQSADMRIDVADTPTQVKATAELPGIKGDEINVSVIDGALTIRGEKRSEEERNEDGYVMRERRFGVIERTVPLPDGVDPDAATATFKDGVLTVVIPKTAEAQKQIKRIPVQAN